ncbi:MAG: Ig-like domain-containing protein [Clostridia bacterium]
MKTKVLIIVLVVIIIVLGLLLVLPGIMASKDKNPVPTTAPTAAATAIATLAPTEEPTAVPTSAPTAAPTNASANVSSVSLNVAVLNLMNKGTSTLVATVQPSNAFNKKVTWKSSDTKIATVNAQGLVTAKAQGTATVTVTTVSGTKVATCKVVVTPQVITGTFVSIEWGDYLHLNMKDSNGDAKSFFVLKNVGVDPETLKKGQKIKVQWQNVDTFLDAPGAVTNIDEIVKIELL